MTVRSFQPTAGATVSISATASSGRHILGGQPSSIGSFFQVRVHNYGTDLVFIRFGGSTVTATVAADMPIPAGAIEVFTVAVPDSLGAYVAAICATDTATVYFTTGAGI
jgi:dihydroxyacetone kinase DhaKLM complex PTS-EIIA-like component DhaM